MKLEIQRQDFLKAWQAAEKIAISRTMIDIVSSIKVNAGYDGKVTLEATDLKTSVKCKADGVNIIEPGTAVLPLTVLGGLLKKLEADTVMLEVKDTKGVLISEGSKSRFSVIPIEEFPNVPESAGAETMCEIASSELSRVILEGSTAGSQPQEFPRYLGSCLLRTTDGLLKVVSTDGKRLAVSEVFCNVNRNEDVLLPAAAVKDLARQFAGYDENVRILSDGPTLWFALENVEFSIRKIEATFPEYERILSNEIYTGLSIPCEKLMSAVERVDIIAKTTIAHIMVMDMNPDGNMKLTARSPEFGAAGEFLEADITGNPLQIGFNASFFLDGLKALGGGDIVIEFSGSEDQTRMFRKDESSFLYMLMPSRISPQDLAYEELNDNESENSEASYEVHEGEQNF